jgi:uncharacterized membrane protein YebE (DUF533 family)
MAVTDIINLVAAAGGGGVVAALLNAVVNKRKLSAEATEIITKAAAGTVANVVSDNTTLRERVEKLETKVGELVETGRIHEQRERAWQHHEERYRWHLERHYRFEDALLAIINQAGLKVADERPALYPDLRL